MTERSTGTPAWVRLGELLAARRAQLDPAYSGHGGRAAFARERGINLKLVQDIENNDRENFAPVTLRDTIAPAYAVTPDSIVAVLEGGGDLEPAAAVPVIALPSLSDPDWQPHLGSSRDPSLPVLEQIRPYLEILYTALFALASAGVADPDADQLAGALPAEARLRAWQRNVWDSLRANARPLTIGARAWVLADLMAREAAQDQDHQGNRGTA